MKLKLCLYRYKSFIRHIAVISVTTLICVYVVQLLHSLVSSPEQASHLSAQTQAQTIDTVNAMIDENAQVLRLSSLLTHDNTAAVDDALNRMLLANLASRGWVLVDIADYAPLMSSLHSTLTPLLSFFDYNTTIMREHIVKQRASKYHSTRSTYRHHLSPVVVGSNRPARPYGLGYYHNDDKDGLRWLSGWHCM